jgi:hypothetical protein
VRPLAHTVVMTLAVVVVTVAQLLDLGTFLRMVALHGAAAEANPLVASMLVDHGLVFVAVAKVAGLSLAVASIVALTGRVDKRGSPALAAAIAIAAIGAGLVGGWTNALAIG